MYYYALIDTTNCICYEVTESETEVTNMPHYVQIDSYDTSYIIRKKYVDGQWFDTTPAEAQNMEAKYIGIDNVWLDDKIYDMEYDIDNHTHNGYVSSDELTSLENVVNTKANSTHTHSEYSLNTHTHDSRYYTETEIDTLLSNKADSMHVSNNSNPHNVTKTQIGLGNVDNTSDMNKPVSTAVQAALDGKASSSHTHSVATSSVDGFLSSSDKIKLDGIATGANAYALPAAGSALGGVKSGGDVTISSGIITVNDDSHNHIISNIDNLQSTLDGKAASSHTHTAAAIVQMASVLFGTNSSGGVEYSYGSGSGKNVLTEISNMSQGLHTAYAISGTTGNPRTTESFRFLIHKTSGVIGWILAWDAQGSFFTNYQSAANTFKGWKCLYDASPSSMILWKGEAYMQSTNSTPQVVTPSKKLSECRTGWMLLWSDYDPGEGSNDTDFCTTFIPKFTPSGGTWGGKAFYCDIPLYVGSDATDLSTEKRCIKPVYVHDDCLKGSYQNTSGGRNDVVLRAVYEV